VALCRVVRLILLFLEIEVMESSSHSPPSSVHVAWWQQLTSRLHGTDSDEHVASMISTHFGLGVDMTSFLSPARNVIASLTQNEIDAYKIR
jgi:hypothetical protein